MKITAKTIDKLIPWKIKLIEKIKQEKGTDKLVFTHIPKCGGSYAGQLLLHFNIQNNKHKRAIDIEPKTTFTIIRDPVERFESLLNYRLGKNNPRKDFPKRLRYVHHNNTITLDAIVQEMNQQEMLKFVPYRDLVYWTKNIDILISIDELPALLKYFGFIITKQYKNQNVSIKNRGTLSPKSKNKVHNVFKKDIAIWKYCISSSLTTDPRHNRLPI